MNLSLTNQINNTTGADVPHPGRLIINADDWGRDRNTTERTLECVLYGTISSVSAMMFMEDSDRAAAIARDRDIDAGLHLNFTTPFSASGTRTQLVEHQQQLSRYLRRHRLSQAIFHPGLIRSFEYVAAAQRDKFADLYGREARRIDGHHHMHLCANVLLGGLLPAGTIARRNFSFEPGEKSVWNRLYRKAADQILARRHRLTDFFFSLPPMDAPGRVQRIFSLARQFTVEVETHPVNHEEYRFLTGGEILRWAGDLPITRHFAVT